MSILLTIHSLWRWLVLLLAIAATGKAIIGWLNKQGWQDLDNRLGLFYTISIDIQFLLGLILYIATLAGYWNSIHYGTSIMRLSMEHGLMMILALVAAHIGRSRAKKQMDSVLKHRTLAIGFGISTILILVGIPMAAMLRVSTLG